MRWKIEHYLINGAYMPKRQINLNSINNNGCKKCSKDMRAVHLDESLCQTVFSCHDDLPVRCVGDWAYDKIYRLVQYFGIFTKGMKYKWGGKINYIEICSGPGRCIFRESGEEVDGTCLAILKHKHFSLLNKAIFIDYDQRVVDALTQRADKIVDPSQSDKVLITKGDFTNLYHLGQILQRLPKNSLNLVFVDPTECNVPFETIKLIDESLSNVDFIINIADGTDANRNLVNALLKPEFYKVKRKYTSFLGSDEFFRNPINIELAKQNNNQELKRRFIEAYKASFSSLGYDHTDLKSVKHYYHLYFASKHPKGLEFWEKANRIEPDGQRTLF